jgi:PAS domain S-box-containing protein
MPMMVRRSSGQGAGSQPEALRSGHPRGRGFVRFRTGVLRVFGVEMTEKGKRRLRTAAGQLLLGIAGLALTTLICFRLDFGVARTGFAYVILITLLSLLGSFTTSILLSIVAAACLNYFFAPPLFEFRIDALDDIERIATFLTTSLIVTALTTKLQRGRNEVEQNQAKWEKAERIAHFGWWERDLKTEHISLSDEACRIFGLEPLDLPKWHERWLDLIHPDDRAVAAAAAALVPGGPRYDVEYRVVRPDGTERVVRSQGDVTWDSSGRPLLQFGVLQDITELRQAEQTLRRNETYLAAAESLIKMGSWAWRPAANEITHWSQGRYRLFGFDPADGFPSLEVVMERIHPDDRALWLESRSLVARGGESDFDFRIVLPDGGTKHVHAVGRPILNQSGEVVEVMGAAADVTDQKQALEALRASEERFRILVDHASDAFFLYNEDGTVLDVNRQACESLGYRRDELIGMTAFDYGPDLTPELLQRIRERLRSGKFVTYDGRHRRKDGTVFPVEVRIRPLWREGQLLAVSLDRDITQRKQAEETLRESEAKLEEAQRVAHIGYWEYDFVTRRYTFSAETFRIFGLTPRESASAREIFKLVHSEDRDIFNKAIMLAVNGGPRYDTEYRVVQPDGVVRFVHSQGDVRWDSGRAVSMFGTIQDITDRKLAEQAVRESEERFRTLVQFSFDLYWEMDAQHRFTRMEFAEGAFDVSAPSGEIGKAPWELRQFEADAEAWRKHRATLDAHLPFRDFEVARPAPEGGKAYMSVSGLPLFEKSGRYIGHRGVGRNITERKRVEEALRRSEAYLAEAQRLSHTGTSVFNANGNVYWSEECYRIWDLDPLDGLPNARAVLQRVHPDDRDRIREEIQKDLHQKRGQRLEFRIVCRDGMIKYIETISHPLLSAQGEIVEVVATHVDVTERRRALEQAERLRQLEADLAHMNRLGLMGELTGSLAHEILHPIATARNNARAGMRFLQMSPPNLAEVMEALGSVVRDADRAKEIVSRIRDHIKKTPPRMEFFDLHESITEVIAMVQSAIERSRVSVHTSLSSQMTAVRGDRVQVQQVVLNLVLNAVEAMETLEGGTRDLSISTEVNHSNDIVVAVRDSGPGIDAEHLEKVFVPFYTTKNSGMGMGLSICRSIIAGHGGRLWAEPNRPSGTVFTFTLPVGAADS